jgi:RNA polymerase sigma-70 factor, ECF subfamily
MTAVMTPPIEADREPDGQTMRRAQSGDEEARDLLARSCQRSAYLFGLQLLRNREDALDVAQEATLRVLSSLGRFDAERPLRPWLLRITRNLVHDRWRRGRNRIDVPLSEELLAEPESVDPEQRLERLERQRLVWRELAALPEDAREIIVLRDYRDLTYAEIAAVLEVPLGTVMSRLHRARARLGERVRAVLAGEGGGSK